MKIIHALSRLSVATLFCTITVSESLADPFPAPRIADYAGDKKAAVSFTFDDGFRHQVENTCEIIEPLGIRGTFFLIPHHMEGELKRDNTINWEEAVALRERGHELGTHGSIKTKLHEADDETLDFLINDSQRLIMERTGVTPVSYAAPGGTKMDERVAAKVHERHAFIRNRNYLPNAVILGYGNTNRRQWDDQKTRLKIEEAKQTSAWVIPIVHAIVEGWSPFKSKDEFRVHCEWLAAQEDLWIAPMGDVGRYLTTRDATTLEVTAETPQSVTFTMTSDTPASLQAPLTVVMERKNVTRAAAKSGAKNYPVEVRDDKILIEALPGGDPITVTWVDR